MPLGTEEKGRRIRTRARAHSWLDTGGYQGGIQLDPYTRQFSRMFDIAEERWEGYVPEEETIFIREFESKKKAYEKHSPFKRVQKWDAGLWSSGDGSSAEKVIRDEETEALTERVDFMRRWVQIKKQMLFGRKRK